MKKIGDGAEMMVTVAQNATHRGASRGGAKLRPLDNYFYSAFSEFNS